MSRREDDFNEESYVSVNERLKQFRKDYPEGVIHTSREGEEGGVIFKCLVFRNPKELESFASAGVAPASGHAYLPDWAREEEQKVEEYTETVSVGRALAFLGYSSEKIASSEEMSRYNRLYGEEEQEPEDNDSEEEAEERRPARKVASKRAEDSDDEAEPKLRSSKKIRRSSKLSSKRKKKGD